MTRPGRRLALVGLDAADLDFIRAASSALPTLHRLVTGGGVGSLRSPAAVLPGAVWPTFYTGLGPGEHGIYHHLQWDADAMRLRRVSADWLGCEPFWYDLGRRGTRVVAVDVPMRFAPRLPGGVEVVNWGSHDQLGRLACNPPEFARDVRRRFGTHPMGFEIPVDKSGAELAGIRDALVAGARRKGELIRWLAADTAWDLLIAVFGETHRGGHLLWPDGPGAAAVPPGALLAVYRAVDAALGEVLATAAAAGAVVLVFALHGMGANASQEHFVPRLMDLVNARFAGDGRPAPAPSPAQPGLVRRLREGVPGWLQHRVAERVPVAVRDAVVNRALVGGHDWARTPGLDVLADLNAYLRLNVRGRERDGMLAPAGETLARYRDWVRACFTSLRTVDTGRPVVDAVLEAHAVFPGPRAAYLPDLVVTWTGEPPAAELESALLGPVRATLATGRSGNHRPDGFCVAVAPADGLRPPSDAQDLAGFVTRLLAAS